ncbi:hypothetical protein [Bacillus phage Anath]|uniref:Uncharacterized protein n=1 Tax=Bacillus phage Anath TaxID=2108114 RepID=A0A2P1JUQ0_9CAUD|nr:hypothetical protein [Bacillus phage Anath]
MIEWIKKNVTKFKDGHQKALDKKAGFSNAMFNKYYGGSELTMSNGEVLKLTAVEAFAIDTKTVSRTNGVSKERLFSIRDKRNSKSTTKRATFRYNSQTYFTDQIDSIKVYTKEEQPRFVQKES